MLSHHDPTIHQSLYDGTARHMCGCRAVQASWRPKFEALVTVGYRWLGCAGLGWLVAVTEPYLMVITSKMAKMHFGTP